MCSATAAFQKWSEWQDFHLRPPGPKPGALKTELHSWKIGSGSGSHTHLKKFMRLLSVHWSSFPQLKLACRTEAAQADEMPAYAHASARQPSPAETERAKA